MFSVSELRLSDCNDLFLTILGSHRRVKCIEDSNNRYKIEFQTNYFQLQSAIAGNFAILGIFFSLKRNNSMKVILLFALLV